jgi:arylsulfatase A-like enzyme
VPFIVRYPARVPVGRVDDTSVVGGVDWFPTVCKLTGVAMPAGHAADGEDVSDIFFGQSRPRLKPLMWEWRFNVAGHVANRSPQLAIREGDWTLLLNPDRSRVELYDVRRDRMQVDNVADRNPEVVARLADKVLAWQRELPDGPRDANAGGADYPWPGESTRKEPTDAAAKKKGKKAR